MGIAAPCHPWHRDIPYILYIKKAGASTGIRDERVLLIGD
jgi:hypothetical protein